VRTTRRSCATAPTLEEVTQSTVTTDDDRARLRLIMETRQRRLLREQGAHHRGELGVQLARTRERVDRAVERAERLQRVGLLRHTQPSIDVICVSRRPSYLGRALDNYRRQICPNTRLTFVANSDSFDWGVTERALQEIPGAQLLRFPERLTLGDCLNEAISATRGQFFAKFDDDDHYGANYLSDLVLATRFADATIYGKRTFHAHVEATDCTVLCEEGHEFTYTNHVAGGTLLVRRHDVTDIRFASVGTGTDTRFREACLAAGRRIFSTDRFNYLLTRRADPSHHTWQISDEAFLTTARRIGDGLRLDQVLA
jgi:hypothetical protein